MKKQLQVLLAYVQQEKNSPRENRNRVAKTLMVGTIVLFSIFLINFAVIIGTDTKFGVDLSEAALDVHQTQQIIPAQRGSIYDRNGVPIAEASTTYSVYAVLDDKYVSYDKKGNTIPLYAQKEQWETIASLFHEFLGMERDYVLQQLSQEGLVQVSFGPKGNNLSYSTMKRLTERLNPDKDAETDDPSNDVSGIYFTGSANRMYPNGSFASHFIGLAQQQENKDGSKSLIGTTGLEASLNTILSGQDGIVTYEKDRLGLPILGTGQVEQEVRNGQDVYTTLSAPLQLHLETAMTEFQEKAQGVFTSATLVQAKTGQILATTQRPSFNSDTKEGLEVEDFSWNSLLYQTNYEPGSTMKVMTTASAIDAGVFDPNESYYNDAIKVADATIRDWDVNSDLSEGRYMTMANALPFSSNIGMTMLEQKMGDEVWLNYLNKFRFGYPTRFGMGAEATGVLPADNVVTYAMSSFGQGISVTQIQMLRAFSAIANDGVMLEPQFITKVTDPDTGLARVSQPEVVGNPVSKDATDRTLEYMILVGTDPNFGTMYYGSQVGPLIQVGNYNVAVKSGTAQIAGTDGTGYLTGKNDYIHSVVAMVPAEDPEYIMYATIQQPKDGWSGLYWQGLFNPLLEEAMLVTDSLDNSQEMATQAESITYTMPKINSFSPGDMADELRRHQVHPIVLGNGSKISQTSIQEGDQLPPNQQVLILTNKLDTLPDFYGWTADNAKLFGEWMGIDVQLSGSGRVVSQSLDTGTMIADVTSLSLTLGED